MKVDQFPSEIQPYLVPRISGKYVYECLGCDRQYGIEELLYTCPECKSVLMIKDADWKRLKSIPGVTWQKIFDYRAMLTMPAMQGIYRYYELIGSVIPLEDII